MSESSSLELFRTLLRTSISVLADVGDEPSGSERLLIRSDATGTMQLTEIVDGQSVVLTDLPEPVRGAHFLPGSPRAVLEIDAGGNERFCLWLLDLDSAAAEPVTSLSLSRLRALTDDPRFGHHFAGVSPDGRLIAYLSDRAGGVDFDLWSLALDTGDHRLVYAGRTWLHPSSGFAPDGRTVAVLASGDRPLDEDLVLIDVGSGTAVTPLAHPDEAALVGSPAWIGDASFAVPSNIGHDFMAIVRHELGSGTTVPLAGSPLDVDVDVVSSHDGSTLLLIENRNGAAVMTLRGAATGAIRTELRTPEPGIVSGLLDPPILSRDGSRGHYTPSTPRMPTSVYAFDAGTGKTRHLTEGRAGVPADRLAPAERHLVTSFDGESVPVFVFRPQRGPDDDGASRPPVVVFVHGGPEAQATQLFNPVIQGLVLAGFGVVVPNVRGSTGYGKRYASLDDTTKRLDSVADLAAVHGFLDQAGFDPARAALWGGSYGGYMVLAVVAFSPELWAAGVDIVGISDLVTFLQNTADDRRAHREREYGSLEHDRAFLESASPTRGVGIADASRRGDSRAAVRDPRAKRPPRPGLRGRAAGRRPQRPRDPLRASDLRGRGPRSGPARQPARCLSGGRRVSARRARRLTILAAIGRVVSADGELCLDRLGHGRADGPVADMARARVGQRQAEHVRPGAPAVQRRR
jgi:acetyl esterase/lipase